MKWHIFVIFLIDMLAVQCLGDHKPCFNKYGTIKYPGKSCADILQERCTGSSVDGVYWIALSSGNTKPFPVFCDMKAGGWTMVFKAIAGVSGRIAGYWKLPYPNFEYSLEALNKRNSFKHHYKNRIVQNWYAFKPMETRVAMYKKSEEVMVLRFEARNSNYVNWFSASKLREAPWQDILTGRKNYFVIEGPCWGGKCRDFHINSVYGGCPRDVGWLSVGDSRVCSWERRFPNSFLYSNVAKMVNYNKHADVGTGDVFAVYLR